MEFSFSSIETSRFGVRCGRCDNYVAGDLERLKREIVANRCSLVTIRCDATQLAAARELTAVGAFLADTIVQFETTDPLANKSALPPKDIAIELASPADEDALASLARDAFGDYVNHYRADSRLDDDAVTEAMIDWTTSFLRTSAARAVLIARRNSDPVGYACMALENGDTAVGVLHGVARHARKQGIYADLLHAGFAWGAATGAHRMTVATQLHNLATQRTMTRLGMRIFNATYTFHYWPGEDGRVVHRHGTE